MVKPRRSPGVQQPRNAGRTAGRNVPPAGWQDPLRPINPIVSPWWLLKWIALTVAAAILCAYLALCLLFYQGQWQIVFHPSRTITKTPATVGLPFDDIHFAYTEIGKPQLSGWWLPAEVGSPYAGYTLLYLHGAEGSLSDIIDRLKVLHGLGINMFAFDYRGFGLSESTHPSEQRVYEDADSALAYLADTRHIDQARIVVYGEGLGAVIAAETALRHPLLPAIITEDPAPPALDLIVADTRTSLLPAKLLFHDRFELAPRLAALKTPKLLLQTGEKIPKPYLLAAAPKTIVTVTDTNRNYLTSLGRFLETSLPKH